MPRLSKRKASSVLSGSAQKRQNSLLQLLRCWSQEQYKVFESRYREREENFSYQHRRHRNVLLCWKSWSTMYLCMYITSCSVRLNLPSMFTWKVQLPKICWSTWIFYHGHMETQHFWECKVSWLLPSHSPRYQECSCYTDRQWENMYLLVQQHIKAAVLYSRKCDCVVGRRIITNTCVETPGL